MLRLFAAVPIPPEIGEALLPRQTGIEAARWRDLDQLHVTLGFFGEIAENQADDLDGELSVIGGEPFDLSLAGAGAFQDGPDINAVWAGVEESEPLRRLASRCEAAARRAGLKPETRNYRPHVTLAYLKHPDPLEVGRWIQANNLLRTENFRVSWFTLFSSRLLSSGSAYVAERDYPL